MQTTTSTRRLQRLRGVTLIESCVVLAVSAVSASLAIPSFDQLRERKHLEGVAAQLETDIMFTRSLAVARNQTLRISFAGQACYVVHTGSNASDCQCGANGIAACTNNAEPLRTVFLGATVPATLRSNSASIAFDAVKGTVTPTATVQVQGRSGAVIRKIVNVMGRVRTCSPDSAVPGYANC